MSSAKKVVILGAGPAGLTAGYLLSKKGVRVTILEKTEFVGGISRTENYKNYLFDIGGHRFYTKFPEVQKLWEEILPNDFATVKRHSRIYFQGKFFHYPLQAMDVLKKLGLVESFLCIFSYLISIVARIIKPVNPNQSFEEWVSNRFGKRLYKMFFKTYTEKVWGIPCSKISADWADQRIKGLDFISLIKDSLGIKSHVTSLIDTFIYPTRGQGMLWERCAELILKNNGVILKDITIHKITHSQANEWKILYKENDGVKTEHADEIISSIPLNEIGLLLDPLPSNEFLNAASRLLYRDFILVALILKGESPFPDQWIYLHDPKVKAGRIQNYKNWSMFMVPNENSVCLGVEYFCFENDETWKKSDQEMIAFTTRDISQTGLILPANVIGGM